MRLPPEQSDPRRMRDMFHSIAPRYDLITRAFSYGMDRRWKREAVRMAALPPCAIVLDLACGTGDFSRLSAAAAPGALTVAADLTFEMLRLARRAGIERSVCADALSLPFASGAFDAVFVGYGMRNFPHLQQALAEIRRVLRPRGRLVSLDFFLPRSPALRAFYLAVLYAQGALWGLLLHGRPRTYTYIPDSLRSFVTAAGYADALRKGGFTGIGMRQFLAGGIAVHWATRGAPPP